MWRLWKERGGVRIGCEPKAGPIPLLLILVPPQQHQPDELLNAAESARRLGVSQDYLYRHHRTFAFARRVGRRLLFSASGIEKYIKNIKTS